jgi:Glycosyl transferases group 1
LSPSVLAPVDAHNPFDLPEVDNADVTLIGSWWYTWLADHHADRVDHVMTRLAKCAGVLVGLNGPDRFNLDFPPSMVDRLASVLCLQGVYRDRDLYNHVVGPMYPGANWTEKKERRDQQYSAAQLEKLRLSVPCFVTEFPGVRRSQDVRRRGWGWLSKGRSLARYLGNRVVFAGLGLLPASWRGLDVHGHFGLSHVQRLEAVEILAGFTGMHGIAPTQSLDWVYGTKYGGAALSDPLKGELVEAARRYTRPAVGRLRYLASLRRHKVGIAPTGYGELGHRHAQIMLAGATLVCQDLSHVEMLLPLIERRNAVFCRPDLSDLQMVLQELLRNDGVRQTIARQGRHDIVRWSSDWRRHLLEGFEGHVRASL